MNFSNRFAPNFWSHSNVLYFKLSAISGAVWPVEDV